MASTAADITAMLEDEEGMRYEDEIRQLYISQCIKFIFECLLHIQYYFSRNPYILDSWSKYLEFKKKAKPRARYLIYERALK